MDAARDARVALFRGLVDHAPLFPPASLGLAEALAEDERAGKSARSFALGRLVWSASRLDELPASERRLSVVLDGPLAPRDGIDAVEAPFGAALPELAGLAGEVYVEVPIDDELEPRLDDVARAGFRAKVRCGGARVPSAGELARFLRSARARALPFKATAGLHHALPRNGEHGSLNLLAAVIFGDEEAALEEEDGAAFSVDANGFHWRDRSATVAEIEAARRDRLRAIGSCSFFEPIVELEALGALP